MARERAAEIRTQTVSDSCTACGGYIVQDTHGDSTFCDGCGLQSDVVFQNISPYSSEHRHKSKPYDRTVHYRQRLSDLTGRGPWIEQEHIDSIHEFLTGGKYLDKEEWGMSVDNMKYVGMQMIKSCIKRLELPACYSARWIQIKSRLDVEGIEDDVLDVDQNFVEEMTLRYTFVSEAFDHTVRKVSRHEKEHLHRTNIIPLNYSIMQIIRIMSEEAFRRNGRFFPPNRSDHQPYLNNKRWKLMIDWLVQNRTGMFTSKEGVFNVEWRYIPVTEQDIFNYMLVYE